MHKWHSSLAGRRRWDFVIGRACRDKRSTLVSFARMSLQSRMFPVDRWCYSNQEANLRLLFREFLRHSLCEENLSFYLDVKEFTSNYRALEKSNALTRLDAIRETLAGAYGKFCSTSCPLTYAEITFQDSITPS